MTLSKKLVWELPSLAHCHVLYHTCCKLTMKTKKQCSVNVTACPTQTHKTIRETSVVQ